MITILRRYEGTASRPLGEGDVVYDRAELMCLSSELADIDNVGNGSVAYAIDEGKLYVFDEDNETWYDEDGTALS